MISLQIFTKQLRIEFWLVKETLCDTGVHLQPCELKSEIDVIYNSYKNLFLSLGSDIKLQQLRILSLMSFLEIFACQLTFCTSSSARSLLILCSSASNSAVSSSSSLKYQNNRYGIFLIFHTLKNNKLLNHDLKLLNCMLGNRSGGIDFNNLGSVRNYKKQIMVFPTD